MNDTELSNDRLVVDRLYRIAALCIVLAAVLAGVGMVTKAEPATIGLTIAPLLTIATGAAGSLATRRTRSADPTQPPPYVPPLEFRP